MNLKKNMLNRNKKGSYLVEAAITLPILIISICSFILIIKIITICESITFVTSTSLIDAMFSYYNDFNVITLCSEVKEASQDVSDFKVTKLRYLYDDGENDNLIALEAKANFRVFDAIGINGNILFEEKVLCRGFAGKMQTINPLEEEEFCSNKKALTVIVFPKYGERYHIEKCRYVIQNISERSYMIKMDREDALRKGYTPCIVCQGAAYG